MSETPTPSRPSSKQVLKILGAIVAICLFPVLFYILMFTIAWR